MDNDQLKQSDSLLGEARGCMEDINFTNSKTESGGGLIQLWVERVVSLDDFPTD